MKYIWDKDDINGDSSLLGGVIESANKADKYILGYRMSNPNDYFLISLDDGMIFGNKKINEFIDFLNEGGYTPVMKIQRLNKS